MYFLPKDHSVPSSVVNYVDEQKKTASFYDTSKLETRDKYAMFFNGNHGKVVITTPTEENRTLLVIKYSYAKQPDPFPGALLPQDCYGRPSLFL